VRTPVTNHTLKVSAQVFTTGQTVLAASSTLGI